MKVLSLLIFPVINVHLQNPLKKKKKKSVRLIPTTIRYLPLNCLQKERELLSE